MTRALPLLHVVTDDVVASRPDFIERASTLLTEGGPRVALHLRAPGAPGRRVYEMACRLSRALVPDGAVFLLNDRVDVALAVHCHGVHLGRRSVPPGVAGTLLGPDALVGVSVHSWDEVHDAGGAAYLFAGSVFATASHPDRVPLGLEGLEKTAAAAAERGLPTFAIGGVTPDRVAAVRAAGAAGVAVLRGVWDEPHTVSAAMRYLQAWEAAAGEA